GEDMLGLSTCWFQIPDERTVCRFDRFLKKACVPRFKTHGYAERDEVLAVLGSCHCSDVFCTPTICSMPRRRIPTIAAATHAGTRLCPIVGIVTVMTVIERARMP